MKYRIEKQWRKSTKPKVSSFKVSRVGNPLARLKREKKMQITRIRNKGKAISNKLKKFKRIVSEYHKQWSTKLDNQ